MKDCTDYKSETRGNETSMIDVKTTKSVNLLESLAIALFLEWLGAFQCSWYWSVSIDDDSDLQKRNFEHHLREIILNSDGYSR